MSCSVFFGAGRSAVSLSSPAAAQKGNDVGRRFGLDSARVERNWEVAKLLRWSEGAMWGWASRSARAGSRRPWRSGGRRKKGEKGRDCGVLGVFIGQGAPGGGMQ